MPNLIFEKEEQNHIYSVSFSPDNKKIAFGNYLNVELYDINTKLKERLYSHKDNILCVTFDRTGQYICSSNEYSSEIKLLNLENRNIIVINNSIGDFKEEFSFIRFSNNNKYLVFGSSSLYIVILELNDNNKIIKLDTEFDQIKDISFSENDMFLAYTSTALFGIVDMNSMKIIESKVWNQYESNTSVDFNPKKNILCLAGDSGGIADPYCIIIDNNSKKLEIINKIFCNKMINKVRYSSDGKYLTLACNNGTIEIRDSITLEKIYELIFKFTEDLEAKYGQNLANIYKNVNDICFSSNSKYLAACCYKYIKIWEI